MENFSDLGPPIFEKSRFFKTPESPILWVPQLQPGATPTWCAQIKFFFANLPPQMGTSKWATKKFLGTKQPFEPLLSCSLKTHTVAAGSSTGAKK